MVIEEKKIEKTCCFYVSDFHLEMILVPYIEEKIEENISILTERKLKGSLEILISRMNLKEENKLKILQLGWDGDKEIKDNSNVIIIGSNEYIKKKNKEIENKNVISILDCYNFESNDVNNIVKKYKNTINTLGQVIF